MEREFIITLLVVIPIVVFPAALVWYMNVGAIYAAIARAFKRQPQIKTETAFLKATAK